MKVVLNNSDTIGIFTSLICSIHCFATPILFVAQSGFASADIQPIWWESINYLFIVFSFIAVYYSVRNTSKKIMKPILWICWLFFTTIILNEIIGIVEISELFSYLSAFSLAFAHTYNLRYCQCEDGECCND
tara:strand:- start:535 stop:930 length:396 start_codon:yes stop_codon:yes gene_type:complete